MTKIRRKWKQEIGPKKIDNARYVTPGFLAKYYKINNSLAI